MRFGGLTAVGDLSFSASAGHITSVIGPNGAGKTTVFNCITGFYRPSSGGLRLSHGDGATFALESMAGHRIARRARVARTFQNIRLFAGMTVLENLLIAQHNMLMPSVGAGLLAVFGLGGHRKAEAVAMERARLWLDAIGLIRRADDPAGVPALWRSAPAGDRAGDVHGARIAVPGRAGGGGSIRGRATSCPPCCAASVTGRSTPLAPCC